MKQRRFVLNQKILMFPRVFSHAVAAYFTDSPANSELESSELDPRDFCRPDSALCSSASGPERVSAPGRKVEEGPICVCCIVGGGLQKA